MKAIPRSVSGGFIALPAAFVMPDSLGFQIDQETLNLLFLAMACGAAGGAVYELVAMQGNIERPHWSTKEEMPEGGYPLGQWKYLLDLGIVARLFIGAAAAVVVYWVIPVETALKFIAVSVVAGSTGTAVFRSVQDRLLAALNAAKIDTAGEVALEVKKKVDALMDDAAGDPTFQATGDLRAKAAEIGGMIHALLKVAGKA